MDLSRDTFRLVLVLCLSLFTAASASASISDGVLEPRVLSERRLLQLKKPCPVNFEFQNYTIITSKCKGPNYLPGPCCSALKEFACRFADELDDATNDCATTMFSYIKLNGNYPGGLFASLCREGKGGLKCADPPAPSVSDDRSPKTRSSSAGWVKFDVLMATVASLVSAVV